MSSGDRARQELENFLRGVSNRKAPPQPTAQHRPPVEAKVVEAEIVERPRAVGSGFQDHISAHTKQFSQQVSQAVSTADIESRIDEKVQQKFDHTVSHLCHQTDIYDQTARPTRPGGFNVLELFQSNNLLDAFILREIMQRPSQQFDVRESPSPTTPPPAIPPHL